MAEYHWTEEHYVLEAGYTAILRWEISTPLYLLERANSTRKLSKYVRDKQGLSVEGLVRMEKLSKSKKFIHVIGSRTRDHPVCSIMPQQLCYRVKK
jgi:hypothetical protein